MTEKRKRKRPVGSGKKRRIYFDGDRALVPLANCKGVAIVDTDCVGLISGWSWSLAIRGAVTSGNGQKMHRLILSTTKMVDHINGDVLDNRRSNLRPADHTQNARNQHKIRGKTSRFKGVTFDKRWGKWCAWTCNKGRSKNLGVFTTEEEAARAYDRAVKEQYGEFARTNEELGLYGK